MTVTPLHPSANGEIERQNRSLMKRIRNAQAESKDLRKEICTYLFAYQSMPHSTTGVSAELMLVESDVTKPVYMFSGQTDTSSKVAKSCTAI